MFNNWIKNASEQSFVRVMAGFAFIAGMALGILIGMSIAP